ncbi:MAG: hypothetical protein J6W56_02570 [Prevotella sp.]|nr:hypothetical protein [Prevotella sp.]
MRRLNKYQTAIYMIGALLMVVGAGTSMLAWRFSPYVFAVGALAFVSMQFLQRYEGTNVVIRRLRRMMLISDFLFLLSALLMIANTGNFLGLDYITYIEYVYNKWVITLLVAAILQLYSTHRISQELDKEAKKL